MDGDGKRGKQSQRVGVRDKDKKLKRSGDLDEGCDIEHRDARERL